MRFTGTVRWFDSIRRLGVIGREWDAPDCHVDHSALRGTVCNPLTAGERVEFRVMQIGLGAVAQDVIRLGFAPPATSERGL